MQKHKKLGRAEAERLNILPDLVFDFAETSTVPKNAGRTSVPINVLPDMAFDLQDDFAACVAGLKSDELKDRIRAIEELGKFKKRAIPFLIAAQKDPQLREAAAAALATVQADNSTP